MPLIGPRLVGFGALVLVLGLPLLGVRLAGRSVADLFRFPPPLEIPSAYVRFSWAAAAAVIATLAATLLPWCWHKRGRDGRPWGADHAPVATTAGNESRPSQAGRRLPPWGAVAIAWTAGWWVLAWTRWPPFEAWQRYTFFPLWMGFVVTVNALTQARTNSCLMLRDPRRWLALFGASAACWWVFEWLNRFVRNWHYLNVQDFGPTAYALHATLCFSTVLPAMAAVAEALHAEVRWRRWTADGPRWPWLAGTRTAPLLAGGGILTMVAAGAFPNGFYPALWVGPLALLLAAAGARGGPRLARELAIGDWSRAATWMAAGLVCGFFWELWNWRSLAKWIYTVPGVERWHVFEMPALGYAGYLPFGLECLIVVELAIGRAWQSTGSPARLYDLSLEARSRG